MTTKVQITYGLCGDRTEHLPHEVLTGSLAPFICTANQWTREPGRSERRLRVQVIATERPPAPMAMLLTRCERVWVDDVWAGRRHEHRERP